MNREIAIAYADRVTVAELDGLMDAMETANDPIPARKVFHRSLRAPDKEATSLANVISVTARRGGALLGYLRVLTDRAYIYYILDVMVHPDWRGQGIGTALLSEALQQCRRNGFIKIFLTAIPGKESFYAKFGFKPGMSPVLTLRGEDERESPPT